MTYRDFVYDIKESLKQVTDDKELSIYHVLYWTTVGVNRLRKEHGTKHDTGLFVSTFPDVVVAEDSSLKDRKYIEIPADIFDLDNEGAVKYVTYNYKTKCCCSGPLFAQVQFSRTTVTDARRIYWDKYEKPSPDNPYFYRLGGRLYFLGLECIDVKDVEVALMTAVDPQKVCDLDDKIPLPPDLIDVLGHRLLNLGSFSLSVPRERINQGSDVTTQAMPSSPEPPEPAGQQSQER